MTSQINATDKDAHGTPAVSIIVTNYNYGHYVEACLDSLRTQTCAPDEIIVVDDGSTDASADILAGQRDVKVISQPNGGQAAAFNTGFEASSSEIVIFVDADDKLAPHAVQVIRRLWSRDISALSYGLSMIDGDGQPIGQYAMDVPDQDLLPQLLSQLTIPFMPTTGNAFRREAIEWAFPLPAEQWRICADALLIRAAILAAPVRHIRQVLGAYRKHGKNNYFREGGSGSWQANRGLRDAARAGLDLVSLTERAERRLTTADRTKLLFAAVRCQLQAEVLAFDPSAFSDFSKRLLGFCRSAWLKTCLALYVQAAQRSSHVRHWAVDPRDCPRLFTAAVRMLRGRTINQDLAEPVLRRTPFDTRMPLAGNRPKYPMGWLSGPEWTLDHATNCADLCAAEGKITLHRVWDGPAKLTLDLEPVFDAPVKVSVLHNGLPLDSQILIAPKECCFTLPEAGQSPPNPEEIEIRTEDVIRGPFDVISQVWRKAHRLRVSDIRFDPASPTPAAAVLKVSSSTQMADLGDVVQTDDGTVLNGEQLIGSGETLSLAVPPLKPPYRLSMRLSPDQVEGHLSVTLNGDIICAADLVSGGSCLIEMPVDLTVFNPALLKFGFRPVDFLEDAVVELDDLGWLPQGAEGRDGLPTLAPGGWAGLGTGRSLSQFLSTGWQDDPDGTAIMLSSSAQLTLSRAAVFQDAKLRLDLEPMDPLSLKENLIVVVSINGREITALQLAGPAVMDVDIGEVLSGTQNEIDVDLYAATRPHEGEKAGNHGGLRLNRLGLSVRSESANVPVTTGHHEPDMLVSRLLVDLRHMLRHGASSAEMVAMRDVLSKAIAGLSPSATNGNLAPSDLAMLAKLSGKLQQQENMTRILPIAQDNWLRDIALRMLSGPAFVTLRNIQLRELPEVRPAFAASIGSYLVTGPASGAANASLRDYQEYLVELMGQARAVLATSPEGSPVGTLANEIVTSFQAEQLLFSDFPLRPHLKAFGRALEAKLLREGHDLFMPQSRHTGLRRGKQRIGVLLRNIETLSEIRVWRAILRELPRDKFEITLFLTEQNHLGSTGIEGCETVDLGGHSLASTVATIRRSKMDVMLLGSGFHGHGFLAEVYAHILAPRQIALAPVFPATTGLSSVDTFIVGKTNCPKSVERDFCEEVLYAPGTAQPIDFPMESQISDATRTQMRQRMGIDQNQIVLVNGASREKIGDAVLRLWAQTLAANQNAVLVLYPFAASWEQKYEPTAFAEEVTAICEGEGVDPRRVRLLPRVSNDEFRQVIASADIYLDTFPYSGATAAAEALHCRLPVVTMQGQSLRARQASSRLIELGLKKCVAKSPRDYVRIVTELMETQADRAGIIKLIDKNCATSKQQDGFAKWLENCLLPTAPHLEDQPAAPRYLFYHMQKTGGTSLKRIFANWFDLVEDYSEPWAYEMPPKLDLGRLGPDTLLCGHFAADKGPLAARYPETLDPQRWRRITFLRDPLARAISMHAFEKKIRKGHDQTFDPLPLGEYLRTEQGVFLEHFECDESNWQAALESYWFIGTLERLPECLDYLAAKLGKPAPGILPHENTTSRDEDVSDDDIAAFRTNNAVEFEIYDAVATRLDALLSEQPLKESAQAHRKGGRNRV
ncbi:MAG: glycosyltransferase [Paracoccaceae bacterium]